MNQVISCSTAQLGAAQARPGGDYVYHFVHDFKVCFDTCKNDAFCLSAQYDHAYHGCLLKNIAHPLIPSWTSPVSGNDDSLDSLDCFSLSPWRYQDLNFYDIACGMDRPGGYCKFPRSCSVLYIPYVLYVSCTSCGIHNRWGACRCRRSTRC